MGDILDQKIMYLTGVGPKRAEILGKELNIYTFSDLLYYFPFRYVDRSRFYSISEVKSDLPYIQLRGKITAFHLLGEGHKQRLIGRFVDNTGAIDLVWFQGISWIGKTVVTNKDYIVFGKPSIFGNTFNIVHPEIEDPLITELQVSSPLRPVYSLTERLKNGYINSKTLQKLFNILWPSVKEHIHETIPQYLIDRLRLLDLKVALYNIHIPQNNDILRKAQYRLKFEELFFIQLNILKTKYNRNLKYKGFVFGKVGDYLNNFYKDKLPFELTEAQKRVIKEIRRDFACGKQMNRLLQGDVGSGKTLVSLMVMLIALDNGYQACMMAPTEILANQHYATITEMLDGLNVRIALLTGSTKKADRGKIHEGLTNGEIQILLGTHALIEDTVQFKNLGFVVIDEQHRFGVAQRAKLWTKSDNPPHVLVMTATPIPRTLAMTLYGDLDVSVIDELPPGRKPIKTLHFYDTRKLEVFDFMKKQIARGRQIYVVFPLIKESEKMDYKNLLDGYRIISEIFEAPQYRICMVHGKLKKEEKDMAMQEFISGKANIMVATTVIEVGVDVPNASVMVIESVERFGLSQIHQLRGRVGRGAEQSYCILMSSYKLSVDAKKRLDIMVESNDGFEIAEADLKLRGPGDLEGTQQSGVAFDLKIANLGRDGQILQYSRDLATEILENDPALQKPENDLLLRQVSRIAKNEINWSVIS
jgi:ATP-dependent DNA helicase RecG